MKKYIISFLQEEKSPLEFEAKTFSQAVQQAIAAGCDLSGADFSFHRIVEVDFSGIDLSGADFSYCALHDCVFNKCNLSSVNFSYAGLWGCLLSETFCEDTDFFFTALVACDVSHANFKNSCNLPQAVFGNLYDAIIPENFTPVCPR